jgi:flagellar motor switch protein FliN/FliY
MADPKPNTSVQPQATTDPASLAEQALGAAQQAVQNLQAAAGAAPTGPSGPNVDLPNFQQVLADVEASGIDLLHDVELNVKIELGRTHMLVEDVLKLAEGSVVELDKLAGDPVDVYVNDRLVARGEVLVLNDNFCVRVSEIVSDIAATAAATSGGGADKNGS